MKYTKRGKTDLTLRGWFFLAYREAPRCIRYGCKTTAGMVQRAQMVLGYHAPNHTKQELLRVALWLDRWEPVTAHPVRP